ncbi:hypothetical protein PP496_gp42 [Gordonia phage Yeet412]|uniref:Uncharacterized protein n=13 Tax=Caudoviricetes TaxID=2731619 RepID=A0A4Y5U0F7_9CAUD|nr:hypothetical protein SEA_KITA_48 [Gordonia phage Kita]YP_009303037.1 hypothetical protein SEA_SOILASSASSIN_42 [Gordonia phage SoilAssassin]YP_009595800.1 hypothetical protein FDH00_gp42 [Gordonia phage Attis]YP_010653078.1 hypothetical protein PP489_gp44 [Gordonia phage Polly]YP_010653539.1 hypothetical protein PP495_gp40 [Gordonia phage Pickett]YP_010653615.1 hypothetical protein PP496_gp42 [Gordonia phage Yeet412]QCG77466.1 hypothetical protein SEA_ANTONIO_47 [Gordonia phage Antonio]QCW
MSASAEFVCEGCDARAFVQCEFADELDDFGLEWDDRHRECVPTVHEVGVACDSGCGREVTHHGVAAASAAEAEKIARTRMTAEGWEEADGFHCRACMLKRSGWQSQPGPAERGRAMSVEAIPDPDQSGIVRALTADFHPRFTDHSTPEGCGCGERDRGTPRPAVVAQAGAGGTASATNLPQN